MNDSTVEEGEFENLKTECLRSGELFEDLIFTPSDESLYTEKSNHQLEWKEEYDIEWIRASEMVEDPKFFLGGAARFDVKQGSVGNCWFVAAMANLTLHEKLFAKVVPPDQSFENDYAGIFHFRFWKDGKWVNVVIDDYLPTINNGKTLFFMDSEYKNEFWSALLEKAYAKLHGSYEALNAGQSRQGGVELSGGLSEIFNKKDEDFGNPTKFFTILKKAFERSSMMTADILVPDGEELEGETEDGLVYGHSYSITKVCQAQTDLGEVSLIRLRNPWGKDEWKGAWSDSSEEWQYLPDDVKTDKIDGEFFIALDDFLREFDSIQFCHLTPDNCDDSIEYTWDEQKFEGSWSISDSTAGGCENDPDTFPFNPQYFIKFVDTDEDDDELSTVVISLLQKNYRKKDRAGDACAIGFYLYQVEGSALQSEDKLDRDFFDKNQPAGDVDSFLQTFEVTKRFKLRPGSYAVIPTTFDPNKEGEFLLRIFSERNGTIENFGSCTSDEDYSPSDEDSSYSDESK